MKFSVITIFNKLQIFKTVVRFVVIHVVDVLVWFKIASDRFFHNNSMFINIVGKTRSWVSWNFYENISTIISNSIAFPQRIVWASEPLYPAYFATKLVFPSSKFIPFNNGRVDNIGVITHITKNLNRLLQPLIVTLARTKELFFPFYKTPHSIEVFSTNGAVKIFTFKHKNIVTLSNKVFNECIILEVNPEWVDKPEASGAQG